MEKRRLSSSRSTIDDCRKTMLLTALAGEEGDILEEYDDTRDDEDVVEAPDDRRNGLRRPEGENRAATACRREECIAAVPGI